jgi:hypothetical protein
MLALVALSRELTVAFAVHPRTRRRGRGARWPLAARAAPAALGRTHRAAAAASLRDGI